MPERNSESAAMDDLVIRARSSREAFSQLFEQYYPRILRYCRARLQPLHAAEDVTSETWLHIAAHLGTFPGTTEEDFRRWAFRIACNAANASIRKAGVRREVSTSAGAEPCGVESGTAGVDRKLDWPFLVSRIRTLNERDQSLIVLRFFEEMEVESIAQVMEMTPAAVRTAVSRAIASLRTSFDARADRVGTPSRSRESAP